jgi:hypothetical protein
MTDNNHPITPPPELVKQWWTEFDITDPELDFLHFIATQAARWGADQELEACCEILRGEFNYHHLAEPLRAAHRRPKPPSLKEQALEALASADGADHPIVATVITADQHALIRRALESLPD